MHLTYRNTCRACGSSELTKVIDLGAQYTQGAFVSPDGPEPSQRKIPLTLVRCDPTRDERACGLLQLSCTVPPQILYSTYWYRSGTNQTMRDHLQSIAEEAAGLIESPSATVLDIGCNDGTLLGFYPNSFSRFGIDPSNAVTEITTDATVIQDLFPSEQLTAAMEGRRFDVITSIAMFYDLEEPIAFASAIRDHLAVDGIWIFEMSYMPAMLSMLSYDTICHEHLEYYSLAVVETILQSAALEIFAVSMNSINGGSIRCLATHAGSAKYRTQERRQELDVLRTREFDLALDTDRPYQRFQEQVEAHRDELSGLVKELKRSGNRIHVYGASTKGNTILQFCGLDNGLIDFAADRNPAKHGCRTLGTNVPIISEEESRSLMPDYYLVLPWHFKPEFLQREKPMLDQGVKMIFPLPTIEVYP